MYLGVGLRAYLVSPVGEGLGFQGKQVGAMSWENSGNYVYVPSFIRPRSSDYTVVRHPDMWCLCRCNGTLYWLYIIEGDSAGLFWGQLLHMEQML